MKEKIKEYIIKNLKWIILFICLIGFFALAEDVFNKEIMNGDIIGYKVISTLLISDFTTPIAKFVTNFGGAIFLVVLTITLFVLIKNKKIGISILSNLVIITILNQLLKKILQRPRPTEFRIVEETGYSFPSGHSMVSMAFYGYLIYLIYKYVKNEYVKWCSIVLLSILICSIGISRIYLGVHYTSDVLGGFLVSISYLIIYISATNKFLIDIVKEELDLKYIGVISGPSIAKEVINDMGLKVVFASNNSDYNNEIKNNFETDKFKIELSDDVIGTELGGTLKNIISIASGLVNGLNLGNNMNAILITKGLEEIKEIGIKLGAKEETFYGLSSLGDLLTTCLSNESRNNRCGILLSQGKTIDEIKEEIGMVIEGLDALKIARDISKKYNINTKIINTLYDIIYNEKSKESIIDAVLN